MSPGNLRRRKVPQRCGPHERATTKRSTVELICCGEPLTWLIAESARAARVHALHVGVGIPVRLWRCVRCEQVTHEGWIPPTWISAVAREADRIGAELDADVERAYSPGRWRR